MYYTKPDSRHYIFRNPRFNYRTIGRYYWITSGRECSIKNGRYIIKPANHIKLAGRRWIYPSVKPKKYVEEL